MPPKFSEPQTCDRRWQRHLPNRQVRHVLREAESILICDHVMRKLVLRALVRRLASSVSTQSQFDVPLEHAAEPTRIDFYMAPPPDRLGVRSVPRNLGGLIPASATPLSPSMTRLPRHRHDKAFRVFESTFESQTHILAMHTHGTINSTRYRRLDTVPGRGKIRRA